MALAWQSHVVAHAHYMFRAGSNESMVVNWSDGITNGSPVFTNYVISIDNFSQANADARSGDYQVDDTDYSSLALITTRGIEIFEDDIGIPFSSFQLQYFAIFGYDGASYSPILHIKGSDGTNSHRNGVEITAVTQLTSDEAPGNKGDIKVTFKLDVQFAATNRVWLEFKNASGFWVPCTKVDGETGLDLDAVPDNTSQSLYWMEPQLDYGTANISDLQLRIKAQS